MKIIEQPKKDDIDHFEDTKMDVRYNSLKINPVPL